MATKTVTTYERDPDGMLIEVRKYIDESTGDLMEARIPFGIAHIIRYKAGDENENIH
jgi:hypothetical protein